MKFREISLSKIGRGFSWEKSEQKLKTKPATPATTVNSFQATRLFGGAEEEEKSQSHLRARNEMFQKLEI